MDVMTRTCIIISNVHGDLCSWSLDGAAKTTAQIQGGQQLSGEQGQEEAQVNCTEKQVRHFHLICVCCVYTLVKVLQTHIHEKKKNGFMGTFKSHNPFLLFF